MELWACGFNAHSQLDYDRSLPSNSVDITPFTRIIGASNIKVLFVGWSQIAVAINDELVAIGHRGSGLVEGETDVDGIAFGDHDGILGIFSNGFLKTIDSTRWPLSLNPRIQGPRIAHIAITGAGRVAIVVWATTFASTFHIMEFDSYKGANPAFFAWIREPTSEEHRPLHFQRGGHCKQLVSNASSFTILTEEGDVLTWGDERHPRLCGRQVDGEDNHIHNPGFVESLGGLKVTKVASGGWMTAAVTEGGDAFIWGMPEPGGSLDGQMQAVKEVEETDQLIEKIKLPNASEEEVNGDLEDEIIDIAVGDGHVLVLDSRGTLWSAGNNREGQLGLGVGAKAFERDWRKVSGLGASREEGQKPKSLYCAPLASFVVVGPNRTN